MSTTNKKIKRIQLKETSYDIAVDDIDKVEGLAEQFINCMILIKI